jgi:glycosyltransferase involved in cell wall biosynthesis
MKVSVLLIAYNEENNLPRFFDALTWCDDIILVDSFSSDRTVEIAKERGARVLQRAFDNFANQRNYGVENGDPKHDWILHLDADEVVTLELSCALKSLSPTEGIHAYNVPSKTMLHGKWLQYSGMYPTYQVRLGHKKKLRFKQVGHGQREDLNSDSIGKLNEPYLHYNFSHGLANWLQKHVKYAEDEAKIVLRGRAPNQASLATRTSRRRTMKMFANLLPPFTRPFLRFFYIYIWCRGFLDGTQGILYAFLLTIYEGMIAAYVISGRLAARRSKSDADI